MFTAQETVEIVGAARKIHANAEDHGFWDPKPEYERCLILIISEITEAMEADRKNKHADLDQYTNCVAIEERDYAGSYMKALREDRIQKDFLCLVKDTVEDEMADVVIRVLDTMAGFDPDFADHYLDFTRTGDNVAISVLPNYDHFLNRLEDPFPIFCYNLVTAVVTAREPFWLFTVLEYIAQYARIHRMRVLEHVKVKMQYNESRPYKHGKSY